MQHQSFAVAALTLALASYSHDASAAAPNLPDHDKPPGVADTAVTQGNIKNNICVPGYTDSLRPHTSETNVIKKRQLKEWGYADRTMLHYEEDHLISLQLGGDALDEGNLWPQPYSGKWGARVKDTLEGELKRRICSKPTNPDHISLKEGRDAISGDWIVAYDKYVCKRTPKLSAKMIAHCR